MKIVSLHGITKKFGKTTAVDGLSLELERGEIFGLVGPDGAGKTTSMRLMLGILQPDSGTGRVGDFDLRKQAESISTITGYVSQRFSLYADLSVSENLALFSDLYRVPEAARSKRFDRLMQFSRLDPFRDRLARNLSGGMKQKLALSCALVHTPQILFLDEPTTGVDPLSRRDLWRLLFDLWQEGLTICVSTPYMDEAERCTRVGFMDRGKIVAIGRPDDLRAAFQGSIFAVLAADKFATKRVLSAVAGVSGVNVFGDRLHVTTTPDQGPGPDALREALNRAHINVHSIDPVSPSMEDVFFQLTAEHPHEMVR